MNERRKGSTSGSGSSRRGSLQPIRTTTTTATKRSRKASITVVEPEMEKLKGARKKKETTAGKIGAGVSHVLKGCFYLLTVCCVLGGEGRPVRTDGRRVSEQEKGVRIKKVESRASEKTGRSERVHRY